MAGTTNPVVRALSPEPHRGDQVAAGVVVLATLVLMVDVRFAGTWSSGARFAVTGLATAFVGTMALRSPLVSDRPRSFQTVLYVTTCLLALLTLTQFRGVLGGGGGGTTAAGTLTWISLLTGLLALAFSTFRNSAYCTLVAAVSFGVCVLAGVAWIFDTHGVGTIRWLLLLIFLADLVGAVMLRDRRRRHAVMLANAAGLAVLVLALILGVVVGGAQTIVVTSGSGPGSTTVHVATVSWGWLLVVFGAGCGLVAYAGADREPGPGYIGVLCLAAFALVAGGSGHATLLGWPLVLTVIAGAFLVLGLRPSHPLPPEPDAGLDEVAMPLPVPPLRNAAHGEAPADDDPEEF